MLADASRLEAHRWRFNVLGPWALASGTSGTSLTRLARERRLQRHMWQIRCLDCMPACPHARAQRDCPPAYLDAHVHKRTGLPISACMHSLAHGYRHPWHACAFLVGFIREAQPVRIPFAADPAIE